ncbi:DUF4381 domain-containing protein [Luteolibacter soli]|uniref:DUF4381 domain-containing protein n=1 Tax=Luteolibacter soli TaxID=3135280 RepID=A0ABU9APB9_9BACT
MNDDPASLERLHDLVVPPPVPWWPPTPGWAMVLVALTLVMLALLTKAFIRWQADRYRREALHLLEDPDTKPAEWSALLKRTALAVWPREEVAHLTGKEWLAFLDRTAGMTVFSTGAGNAIESIAFDPKAAGEGGDLKAAVREWIQRHRKEGA